MHNVFLGTAKKMLKMWKEQGLISDADFQKLQEQMDDITPPGNVGRLPHKISAQFSGFTAEQWMLWTVLYSPFLLRDFLPQEHYEIWCLFSQACSYLCSPHVHERDVF